MVASRGFARAEIRLPDKMRHRLNRQIVLLTVGLWIAMFGVYMAPMAAVGNLDPRDPVFYASCSATGATLSALLYLVVRASRRIAHRLRVTLVAVAALAALSLHAFADTVVLQAMFADQARATSQIERTSFALVAASNFIMLAPVYGLYLTCVALTLSALANQDKERRLAAAHAATQEAQLRALRFQINPHFLFNALNAVTALVGSARNAEAAAVVARLSSFFRATLNTPPGAMIPLEEEIDTIGSYLDIEAARFGPRLVPEIDCPKELAEALVPHFLLQPLVENAVKHGVARSKAPVAVVISAAARDGLLVIRVSDDAFAADAAAPSGAGVGLSNVGERLTALYGEAGRLTTGRQGRRFVAEIQLPLVFARQELAAA
jgi:sensor histidine kinase YesM